MPKLFLTKRYFISALHSLENPSLSPEENKRIFGPCYRLHGHDYGIEVRVSRAGEPDVKAQWTIDPTILDQVMSEAIIKPFHKTNLNNAFTNTSGEALALEFFEILNKALPESLVLDGVTVLETRKNTFEAISKSSASTTF